MYIKYLLYIKIKVKIKSICLKIILNNRGLKTKFVSIKIIIKIMTSYEQKKKIIIIIIKIKILY